MCVPDLRNFLRNPMDEPMNVFKMPGLGGNAPELEYNEATKQYDPTETQAESLIRRFGEEEAMKHPSWPGKADDSSSEACALCEEVVRPVGAPLTWKPHET